MLEEKADGLYSGGSTWGDLPLHMAIISAYLERGVSGLAEFPVYTGEKLHYPLVADFTTALLIQIGFSYRKALFLPTLIVILIAVAMLYFVTKEIIGSRIAGFLTPFLLFFNGSLYGFYHFWQDWNISEMGFMEFLQQLPKQYSQLPDQNLQFTNIVVSYVLPQRAFVWGVALGLLGILYLWRYWNGGDRQQLLRAGIATAFLPMVHMHTFIAMIFVSFFLLLSQIWDGKKIHELFDDWVLFAIPVGLLGLPQVLWMFPFGNNSFMRIQLGWMAGKEDILLFWLKNLPLQIVVFAAAYWWAPAKLKRFYLPFLAIFIIANIIIFQPYDFDNMKLMIWWYILSAMLTAGMLVAFWKQYGVGGSLLSVVLFSGLTIVGVLAVYRESHDSWQLFSNEDVELANFVKEHTPAAAVFLTPDNHNNPIPSLAGRRILMGYGGWLWSHGINYVSRQDDVHAMYAGNVELLQQYNIEYVVMSSLQQATIPVNTAFFAQNFELMYHSDTYQIFKVSKN